MGKKNSKWLYALIVIVSVAIVAEIFIINKKNENNNSNIESNFDDSENIIEDKSEEESKEEVVEESNEVSEVNNELLMLVNKQNLIDSNYVPEDLVLSDIEFLSYIETRYLRKETAEAAKAMFDAALQDGITLLGASGYRSYDVQVSLFNGRAAELGEEEASKYTAPPGASEHQTGLALDILGADYQYMDDDFDTSESFNWLINNCYKYGFILRFLKGKEDITGYGYEPWHYRYIGNAEIAEEIMKNNLTLEEYLER